MGIPARSPEASGAGDETTPARAACGQGDARESAATVAEEVSQTTQATQPVVTVYKSPT